MFCIPLKFDFCQSVTGKISNFNVYMILLNLNLVEIVKKSLLKILFFKTLFPI